MTEPPVERRDPTRSSRRSGDLGVWLSQRASALAIAVVVLFAVLAVLAFGIAVTSATAEDALDLNRVSSQRNMELRREVSRLAERNDALMVGVEALRRQVEDLGGIPIEVIIEDRREPGGSTSTTQPDRPPATPSTTAPSSTTTTTEPCEVQVRRRCVVPP